MARLVNTSPALPNPPLGTAGQLLRYSLDLTRALFTILSDLAVRSNSAMPKDGTERMLSPLPLAIFTISTRPNAALWTGAVIFVSDATAGNKFQGSDGASWVSLG